MNAAPQFSVIMNCRNCARYLRAALDSVAAQTYADWEIVFWDNQSEDGSPAIARAYGPKLRYFRGEEPLTLGAARNCALRQARGRYLAFLDCDDIWLPDKLALQNAAFARSPGIGLVFGDAIQFDERGRSWQLYRHFRPPEGRIFRSLLQRYFLWIPTVAIRRKVLDGLPEWFDPLLSMVEEMDLFLRIAHDWELAYVPEPLARYRIHAASATRQQPELYPREIAYLLDKFERLYPGLRAEAPAAWTAQHAAAARAAAHLALLNGEARQSRSMLRPHLGSPKSLALFASSYLPRPLYAWLRDQRRPTC